MSLSIRQRAVHGYENVFTLSLFVVAVSLIVLLMEPMSAVRQGREVVVNDQLMQRFLVFRLHEEQFALSAARFFLYCAICTASLASAVTLCVIAYVERVGTLTTVDRLACSMPFLVTDLSVIQFVAGVVHIYASQDSAGFAPLMRFYVLSVEGVLCVVLGTIWYRYSFALSTCVD